MQHSNGSGALTRNGVHNKEPSEFQIRVGIELFGNVRHYGNGSSSRPDLRAKIFGEPVVRRNAIHEVTQVFGSLPRMNTLKPPNPHYSIVQGLARSNIELRISNIERRTYLIALAMRCQPNGRTSRFGSRLKDETNTPL